MKKQLTRLLWAGLAALPLLAACGSGGDDGGFPGVDPVEESATKTAAALEHLNQQSSAGLVAALGELEQAVVLDPGNSLAQAMLGGVRLVAFVDDNRMPTDGSQPSEMAELMDGFGMSFGGLSIFQMVEGGELPPMDDLLPLPNDAPTVGDLQAFLAGEVLDNVRLSIANFEQVPPTFSEVVELFGESVEIDYGDLRLGIAALRAVEAVVLLQSAFDFNADIDELVNWEANGLSMPYRLFTGDSPMNVIIGQTTPAGRKGFLNEPLLTGSMNTLLPAAGADQALMGVRQALVGAIQSLQAALTYVEDLDQTDDLIVIPPEILCPVELAAPWIADVVEALAGGDTVVAPLMATDPDNPDCSLELPGFTLNAALLLSSSTWDNRLLFPDYPDGTTTATEDSWNHLLTNPSILQLLMDFGGTAPEGADILALWNGVNGLWDTLFAGEALEEEY